MKTDDRDTRERKPYVKPVLQAIELKAEEVLAVGCKRPGATVNVLNASCGIVQHCLKSNRS